ncbi:MAG TPA: HAD-IA family hydrolase [Gammaproteobacteria bacterium]|jgi:putative hydrolase of the HAD superfamily
MNDTTEPTDGCPPVPEQDSREPPTEVLLFDAGGVLIDLGDEPLPGVKVRGLAAWLRSPIALAFEKGLTTADEFAAAWIDGIGLDCDAATLIEHFRRWPIGPFAGVPTLLSRLAGDYRIAILTNTNELHWPRFTDEFELDRYAERIFASHQLGMAKPEAEIFHLVVDELGTAPNRILFVDDNLANVDAARAIGLRAERVGGFDELLRTLAALAIIDAADIVAIESAAATV